MFLLLLSITKIGARDHAEESERETMGRREDSHLVCGRAEDDGSEGGPATTRNRLIQHFRADFRMLSCGAQFECAAQQSAMERGVKYVNDLVLFTDA